MDLNGVWVTVVTPFRPGGAIDHEVLGRHAGFLAESGIGKLVPGGNTGEYFSLEPDEALAAVVTVRKAAPDALVVAGVGGELTSAIRLARDALAAGADGIMVHQPIQTYVGLRGLELYYRRLLETVDGKALLYKRGPQVPDDLLVRLTRSREIWGVKYAVNDLLAFDGVMRAAPEGVWICGTAELWAPFFALLGARGFTSGLANAAPAIPLALDKALRGGDFSRAMELRRLVGAFEELRAEDLSAKNVPAVRVAMELAGFPVGDPRVPIARLEARDVERVRTIWRAWEAAGLVPAAAGVD